MHGDDSRFWLRHPIAEVIFLLVVSAGFFIWAIAVIRQGSFVWGHPGAAGGPKITRKAMTIQFWLVVSSAGMIGFCIFIYVIRKMRRYRRRQTRRRSVSS